MVGGHRDPEEPLPGLVSRGGCITSALMGASTVEVVGAVLGAVGRRAGRGVGARVGWPVCRAAPPVVPRNIPWFARAARASGRSRPVMLIVRLGAERMNFAHHSAVSLRQNQNDGGRRQAADLEQDEHQVPAMDGKRTDEQAAHEPHRPCTAADARGAMFPPEVDGLGHIGQHRDRDSCDAENFKTQVLLYASADVLPPPAPTVKSPELAARRKELAPGVHEALEDFSHAVFADGALSKKNNQLIAASVADVTQCPYYISGTLGWPAARGHRRRSWRRSEWRRRCTPAAPTHTPPLPCTRWRSIVGRQRGERGEHLRLPSTRGRP